jgi:hypothetical protein
MGFFVTSTEAHPHPNPRLEGEGEKTRDQRIGAREALRLSAKRDVLAKEQSELCVVLARKASVVLQAELAHG